MKKISVITTIVAMATLLFIVSCKKKDATPAASASATTLKGLVKAELNLATNGKENVPDGTKIIFLIDPNDLLNKPDTSKKYDSYRYTATVSGGAYSINLPARNKGSKVTIVGDEFEFNMVLDGSGTTQRVIYSIQEATITIYAGTTEFYDINY